MLPYVRSSGIPPGSWQPLASAGMIAYFSRLPSECAASNMSKALYARLLCHELLPLDVERAIAMDLGDILVFEDILGLWESSSNMFKKYVCGSTTMVSLFA